MDLKLICYLNVFGKTSLKSFIYKKIINRLDREKKHCYIVKVEAYDLGFPQRKSTKQIKVVLKDVNDFKPEFLLKDYNKSKNYAL